VARFMYYVCAARERLHEIKTMCPYYLEYDDPDDHGNCFCDYATGTMCDECAERGNYTGEI